MKDWSRAGWLCSVVHLSYSSHTGATLCRRVLSNTHLVDAWATHVVDGLPKSSIGYPCRRWTAHVVDRVPTSSMSLDGPPTSSMGHPCCRWTAHVIDGLPS